MASDLKPVDEVLNYLVSAAKLRVSDELVAIKEALARVLAEDLRSTINVPQADNSAMDGYALARDNAAVDRPMSVSQRIPAGVVGTALAGATAARIFTGAFIPEGADAVIMQENTSLVDGKLLIHVMPDTGQNIRRAGQDIEAGDVILSRGRLLRSQDIGLMASVGISHVRVFKKLKVAILCTGDELVEPGSALGPGQIYNSNRYTLRALIEALGMEVVDLGIVKDNAAETRKALSAAAATADCILCSGGVSVGEEDHVKAAVEALGQLDLWRIAIKPGKPLAFGSVAGVPFFGLPGNPVSTYVTFMVIARPYLLKTQGHEALKLPCVTGNSLFSAKAGGRREYYRVQLTMNLDGECVVENFANQGSGILSSTSWANGLAVIEIGQSIEVGDPVKVLLLP